MILLLIRVLLEQCNVQVEKLDIGSTSLKLIIPTFHTSVLLRMVILVITALATLVITILVPTETASMEMLSIFGLQGNLFFNTKSPISLEVLSVKETNSFNDFKIDSYIY
jgi:hypothetical protein